MRLGITKEIDWEYLGALMARSDAYEQSSFLKSFIKECQSWGTSYQVQMQLTYINKELTDEEKEILSMITYIEKVAL